MRQDVDRLETEGIPMDVAARLEMVQQRIEHPLTEEQTEQVRNRIARSIALGVALRGYPLSNADEPEIAFDPFAGGER
ncbi:MAG: hypothetical protein R2855_19170 [Thermomicrobiales bacterium]